jgi:hypothetical protein
VKRKQFTLQEQLLLAGRCDSVILDAADEALYRLGGLHANRSLPSLQSSSSTRSSRYSIDTSELANPAAGMDTAMMDSFRWLDGEDNLDLTLDDYHTHVVDAALHASKRTARRPSFRRNLSLTNLPFGRDSRSSSDQTTPRRGSSQLSQNQHRRMSTFQFKQQTPPPVPALDSAATHYQDPEARLKLRVYLASPQKFDEALEFGFPSLQVTSRPGSRRPSVSQQPPIATSGFGTFFDDDNGDPFSKKSQGEESETIQATDSKGPSFETPVRHAPRRPSLRKPDLSEAVRPHVWHTASEPYAHASAMNREMTLRMTLTRPDLRADENLLYPKGEDPLALDDLPPTMEGGDIWDRLGPKEDNMMKKLWRRVSRKI